MRVLITGAGGFVGQHLIRELSANGHDIIAFDMNFPSPVNSTVRQYKGDLLDIECLNSLITSTAPDACVHLGAISFTPSGKNNAPKMFSVNVVGTINVLEAFRKNAPSARILVISTAHVYGTVASGCRIKEESPLNPSSMYAISKAAADIATLEYSKQHDMYTMTARPNNHIGPGQSTIFVIPSFAQQLKQLTKNNTNISFLAGNMDSIRDFTDVRDVVTAYRLLLEKGQPGKAYNISSNNLLSIKTVFTELCRLTNTKPEIVIDKERFRPTDSSPLLDITRIQADTDWKPQIPLTKTLEDILAEY